VTDSSLHTLQRVPSPIARDLGAIMLSRAVCSCGWPATRVSIAATLSKPNKRDHHQTPTHPVTVASIEAWCGRFTERCGKSALPDAASAYADDDYGDDE
jgi:hypothetical protein